MRNMGISGRAILISVLLLVWLLPQNIQTNRVHAEPGTVIVTVAVAHDALYRITLSVAQLSTLVTTLAASTPTSQIPAIPGTATPSPATANPPPTITEWQLTLRPNLDQTPYLIARDLESLQRGPDEAKFATEFAQTIVKYLEEQNVSIESVSSEYDCQYYYLCEKVRREENGIEEVRLKWAREGSETVSYALVGVSASPGETLSTASDDRAPHLDLSYRLNPEIVSDDHSENP